MNELQSLITIPEIGACYIAIHDSLSIIDSNGKTDVLKAWDMITVKKITAGIIEFTIGTSNKVYSFEEVNFTDCVAELGLWDEYVAEKTFFLEDVEGGREAIIPWEEIRIFSVGANGIVVNFEHVKKELRGRTFYITYAQLRDFCKCGVSGNSVFAPVRSSTQDDVSHALQ